MNKRNFIKTAAGKYELSHTDEFSLRVDLDAVEQKLNSIKWIVIDSTLRQKGAITRKIADIRRALDEIEGNL